MRPPISVVARRPDRRRYNREAEPEERPPTFGLVDVHGAALVAGHLGHDGQSQSGARLRPGARGPVEAVEDEVDVAGVDPGPCLLYTSPSPRDS